MAVPPTFTTPTQAIATFNSEDLINGFGIITFRGSIQQTSAATTYNLVTNTLPSRGVGADRSINQTNSPYNFDSQPFTSPRTVTGDMEVVCQLQTLGNSLTPTFKVQHIDGAATATDISATTSPAASAVNAYVFRFKIPLTTKHFSKGEFIRIIVTHPVAANTSLPCDPSGEYLGALPMQFNIPFQNTRIDI